MKQLSNVRKADKAHGGELRDGHFRQVADGRTAVLDLLDALDLLDTLNVQDLPEEFVR